MARTCLSACLLVSLSVSCVTGCQGYVASEWLSLSITRKLLFINLLIVRFILYFFVNICYLFGGFALHLAKMQVYLD